MIEQRFEEQLAEVRRHYESGDSNLGLRRLLDCAIETQDATVFREVLSFCDWSEIEANKQQDSLTQVLPLLEKMQQCGVKITTEASQGILEIDQLSKKYSGSGFQLNDISFQLEMGNIMGLVGENGNGKTTLLRLIAGELKPDSGVLNYSFFKDANRQYDLKTQLIYVEQRIPRWYGSLMDNLKYTTAHYHGNWEENELWTEILIARMGLRPYKHLTWGRISSGYRTRFELAKTLLRRPKLLLLDEPLANLDILAQQTILQDLKFMANSISSPFAMILSSQHIYEVEKVSDSILFIRDGKATFEKVANMPLSTTDQLILEIEVMQEREQLKQALAPLQLNKIQYNGGVYLLHFNSDVLTSQVFAELAKHEIEVQYFRNISQSSRRFFI